MELEKITRSSARRYEDGCATAHALDLLGERWALLVMRELMFGPRRFGDLRASLPALSANVLTQRLEGLEAAGVLRRTRLPPPASVQVYELTEWGLEAEPIVLALGRWGARSPDLDPSLPFSAISMMLSFRAMFDAERARGATLSLEFRFGAETFSATVRDATFACVRGQSANPDVIVAGQPAAVARAVYGLASPADLEAEGTLALEGDRAAWQRFAEIFELPAKAR